MQRAQLCVLSGRHSEDTHDFYIYKCRSNQAQTFHALRRATPKSKCRSKGSGQKLKTGGLWKNLDQSITKIIFFMDLRGWSHPIHILFNSK